MFSKDPDVAMDVVFGEDYFYDPRSRKPDESDDRGGGEGGGSSGAAGEGSQSTGDPGSAG